MNNFEFYNPTKVVFGENQIEKLCDYLPSNARILLLFGGGSIKTNGVYNKIIKALSGKEVFEFGGITANPEYEDLLGALKNIKSNKVNFILAVGGGSVIDGAKFLSAAFYFKGDDPWQILKDRTRVKKGLPFGTILTLPATGSEMNSGAVITRKATKEKLGMGGPGLFPVFSILDPNVVRSLPKRQIANGIVDAFTHVLEQYMTYPTGAILQDKFSESILQTLIEIAPRVLSKEFDYKAASNFMWSCTMALNGLIQKGVPTDWAIHMIGHELTAEYGIDHARTLAIILKSRYQYSFEEKKEKLAQYGRNVWGIETTSDTEAANKAIDLTVAFFHELEIPTKLSDYTSNYDGISERIANRFQQREWLGLGEHKSLTPSDVARIVEMAY